MATVYMKKKNKIQAYAFEACPFCWQIPNKSVWAVLHSVTRGGLYEATATTGIKTSLGPQRQQLLIYSI